MHAHRPVALATALVTTMLLALVGVVPAGAEDGLDETVDGPLQIDARPTVVAAGDIVTVSATFDSSAALDPECDPEEDDCGSGALDSMSVDFGDGSDPVDMAIVDDSDGTYTAETDHAFTEDGSYDAEVTATDDVGDWWYATVTIDVGTDDARVDGADRIETAIEISQDSFDDGSAGAVLLVRDDGFADALTAATLALAEEAPVLLVPTGIIPVDVLSEIERVLGGPGKVYLLGGDAAISPEVENELQLRGHTVVRIAGEDRVATSVAVGRFLVDAGADVSEVVLADAANFPDALSGAAYAAEQGDPVLLTDSSALSPEVREFLLELGTQTYVTVVGGTAGVSDAVVDELTSLGFEVDRFAGDDRYDTSVDVADNEDAPTTVVIATGDAFPDALSGSSYAARLHAPLLLVGHTASQSLLDYLARHADTIETVIVLGGSGAVSPDVLAEIDAALGR